MRLLSYILISRKTAAFLWPSLSNEQHPGHLQGRLYVHCSLRVGTHCRFPQLRYDTAVKQKPIKKLPDDSSKTVACSLEHNFTGDTANSCFFCREEYRQGWTTVLIRKADWDGVDQCSRYTDSLRAGRSGDRIAVGVRFSAPVQTGTGAHPASCTMGTSSLSTG